jgi:hypothetical protein
MVTQNEMTPAQWSALGKLFDRQLIESENPKTFSEFCELARMDTMMDCVMVPCFGMWLGIEKDGYTHS